MTEEEKNLIKSYSARKNNSWLNSDSFIKRSLSIAGYSLVGLLIIYAGLVLIAVIIGMVIGILV